MGEEDVRLGHSVGYVFMIPPVQLVGYYGGPKSFFRSLPETDRRKRMMVCATVRFRKQCK